MKTEHMIEATGPGDVLMQVIGGALRGAADQLAAALIRDFIDRDVDPVILMTKINDRGLEVDLAAALDFPSTIPDIGSPEPPERLAAGKGGVAIDPGMLESLQPAPKIVEP